MNSCTHQHHDLINGDAIDIGCVINDLHQSVTYALGVMEHKKFWGAFRKHLLRLTNVSVSITKIAPGYRKKSVAFCTYYHVNKLTHI